jgi:hypothetical protein
MAECPKDNHCTIHMFLAPAACAALDHQPDSESNQGDLSVAASTRLWLFGDFDNDLQGNCLGTRQNPYSQRLLPGNSRFRPPAWEH